MRTGIFFLLSMASVASFAAQGSLRLDTFGPGESVEHVWLLTAQSKADVDAEDVCEVAEFEIVFSDPAGFVPPVRDFVSLTPEEPVAKVRVVGFGEFVLTERKPRPGKGACEVRRHTRIVREDGSSTAATVKAGTDRFDGDGSGWSHPNGVAHGLEFHAIGPGEKVERVLFAKYGGTEVENSCEGVEVTVETFDPLGVVAKVVDQISLAPGSLYVVTARFAHFGDVILMKTADLRVQGNCVVLTSGRVARADDTTISTFGNFQIHPPNNGHPYD